MKHCVILFCWPNLHQKKIHRCVRISGYKGSPTFQSCAKCKPCRNYALCSTHYKFPFFSLESLALSSFQRHSVGGDQAVYRGMNGSTGAGVAAEYSLPQLQPTGWGSWGQRASVRKASDLHENGSLLPRRAALTSRDAKQRSGYFNTDNALDLSFSSNTGIPSINLDDDAMRNSELSGVGMWAGACTRVCAPERENMRIKFPLKSQVPWGLSQPLGCNQTCICVLYC